jgi:hypothetical protein
VYVKKKHARNHDGTYFSVLITETMAYPAPGSDEISRACEEGWVGSNGYVKLNGSRQNRALAFQGHVADLGGNTISEVFIVDLPDDLTIAGAGPLEGTASRRPRPPRGTIQRRLTHTAERKYPGLQGPRHWLRSSPDGAAIAFLMRDDYGVVQLWTVSPNGGLPRQLTHNPWSIASAFSWSPAGKHVAHIMDNSVCVTDAETGKTTRLTAREEDAKSPRPEACVFSPEGSMIAFVKRVETRGTAFNQVFVCRLE